MNFAAFKRQILSRSRWHQLGTRGSVFLTGNLQFRITDCIRPSSLLIVHNDLLLSGDKWSVLKGGQTLTGMCSSDVHVG